MKDQWDCVLNDLGELGGKEFLVLMDQYNMEIFSCFLAACHFTLPHFIRPMLRVFPIRSEDNLLISKIQSHHLLLEVDDHDEAEYSVVLTLSKR